METQSKLKPILKVTQKRPPILDLVSLIPHDKMMKCPPEMINDLMKIAQDLNESFKHASTKDIKMVTKGQLIVFVAQRGVFEEEKTGEMLPIRSRKMKFKQLKRKVGDYEVVLTLEDEGIFSVEVPKLPGCFSFGKTIEEALKNAQEAINCHVAAIKKHQK